MKTVGFILKEARQIKGLRLSEVEDATKIREKFLDAIERDAFGEIPSLSYAKGFVKNYSEYLGLNSRTVLAFFRRQTVDTPKSSLLPKGVTHPLNRTFFQLTPAKFIAFIVSSLVGVFLVYLGLQYGAIAKDPSLVLESPVSGTVVTSKRVEVVGITDPDATVTVQGVSVLVRNDGKFFDQVLLEAGVNKLTVTATSRFGKSKTVIREVGFTP